MQTEPWSLEQAQAWSEAQPWRLGCNFIPSTAINQLEMWQAETFDPVTLQRELSWAARLGLNAVRVYLHDLVWQAGADGFVHRLDQFLSLAAAQQIQTVFVIFDDCWNSNPALGQQPAPIPGVHNSGWVQSPGVAVVNAPEQWPRLRDYVTGVVSAFANDARIMMWDLYNEPGNQGQGDRSLPLLRAVVDWARSARPQQPLTIGLWSDLPALNEFQLAASDVVSFHHYGEAPSLQAEIERLKQWGRPLICTEYMARTRGSRLATHLPLFRQAGVGCFNWGLVNGKTQTIYPWGSPPQAPEPGEWFHDLLHADGTPYRAQEAALLAQFSPRGERG